jgi:hypothetical protein
MVCAYWRHAAGPAAAVLALMFALSACDDRELEGPLDVAAFGAELVGFWEGELEIAPRDHHVGTVGTTEGFVFPVALDLGADRRFVLWSVHFPIAGAGATELRRCTGVYTVRTRDRSVALFADRLCRALPLSRYRVRRLGLDRLILEARGREPAGDAVSIRVRLSLERAEAPFPPTF